MSTTASATRTLWRHSAWLLVPPPLLFGAAFGVGALLERVAPSSVLSALGPAAVYAGIAAIAAAFITPSSALLFAWHRTTIVPHGKARLLLTTGPYRLTRNPMYLGLALGYLGIALVTRTAWPLASLSLPLWVLQTKTIPLEERNLVEVFGDEYRAYAKRVRRWL